MASPEPPVALSNTCSIIHDNVLYVYSPEAFQTLPLSENATWTQQENGVSVTGAVCVKGGLDGDNNKPALYVVGGAVNASAPTYSGLQRYSILDNKWETINPISAVTVNLQNHGAAYLNASSAILIYGGSQNGAVSSTETYLMLMYPPYRVQAYSAQNMPAVTKPFLLPFTEDKALMVGGGNGNQRVFTFHPDPGWQDLGVTLPTVLPAPSVAQVNLQALADGTRILQTFYTNETPNGVTRLILTNPGFVPAPYNTTIGGGTSTTRSRLFQRQLNQGSYPSYNSTYVPSVSRNGASLASDSQKVAIVGGDSNSTVALFDSSKNSWVDTQALFGDTQKPLTVSSSTTSSTSTPTPTPSSSIAAAPAASTAAAAKNEDSQTNGLAILGGVLGGICGLAAILIITLLWLRSVKRRKAHEAAMRKKQESPGYPDDKPRGLGIGETAGGTPLSQQAQPMGRSPVPSAIITDRDSLAMFGAQPQEKQTMEAQGQRQPGSRLNPNHGASNSTNTFFKSNNKTPLTISKPMLPDLGDYQERPSIDLGKATPSNAPVLPPVSVVNQQNADQRRTDEGWAKYFQADKDEKAKPADPTFVVSYEDDPRRSTSRPSTAKGGGTGFWPGSGAPSTSNRSTKLPTRDSAGNLLTHSTVSTASPSLAVGHENLQTRNLSVAAPAKAKFSSGDSISTDHTSDDGYEDDEVDAYSDTRDSSYQQNAWNPIGSTWSGPSQRPLRPPSVRVGASAYPPPTNVSEETTATSGSGGSSIPSFPMPHSAIGRADTTEQYTGTTTVQRPENAYASRNPYAHARQSSNTMQFNGGPAVSDYFGPPPRTASSQGTFDKGHDSNDMSWLNLGTPAHMGGSPPVADPRDPA